MVTFHEQVEVLQRHCIDTFGEDTPVLYAALGGSPAPFTVLGIFRSAGAELEVGTELEVQDQRPEVHIILADLVAKGLLREPVQGDRLTITPPGGVATLYRPEDNHLDGEGIMLLHLLEVAL